VIDIGSQVVCITDEWEPEAGTPALPITLPVKGQVYTIRLITRHFDNWVGVLLEEIFNPPLEFSNYVGDFSGEATFAIIAFRPVKPTSIEQFRQILIDAPKPKQFEPI